MNTQARFLRPWLALAVAFGAFPAAGPIAQTTEIAIRHRRTIDPRIV